MKVVSLSDYFVSMAEDMCNEKFENDIMLVYNDFSNKSKEYIIDNIKISIKDISDVGVIFDNNLVKVFCSMYLSLAWSMHRKGKVIQRDKKIIDKIKIYEYYKMHSDIWDIICDNYDFIKSIDDLSLRYYTLHFSQHFKDTYKRMEIHNHPYIDNEQGLKNVLIENLKIFGMKILANGIIEEYMSNKK